MGFADSLKAETLAQGPTCTICTLLTKLDKADAAALVAAMADPSVASTAISRGWRSYERSSDEIRVRNEIKVAIGAEGPSI